MKKCGYKEECFVPGACWGHFEKIMCEHLGEVNDISICNHDNQEIECYGNWDDDIILFRKHGSKIFNKIPGNDT